MRREASPLFTIALLLSLYISSCTKDEFGNYSKEVSFEVTANLLEGQRISCIDIDSRGNYCIGSGNDLYCCFNGKKETINIGFRILAAAIASDATIWVGTDGGGLGHIISASEIIWYNMSNAGLPRDFVRHVEIAPDGTIWFTSCAHMLGGLGIFDGVRFEFMTPENSSLNQNVIEDIKISRDGSVYIATTGTVGRSNIYRIKDRKLDCLGDEEGMFYWIFSFTISPSGELYVIEDFSLSSMWHATNNLYEFSNNRWMKIETGDIETLGFFYQIKSDRRGYCWIPGYYNDSPVLNVYNGKTWITSPPGNFPEDFFTCIETDFDNNLWLGTYSHGVFILNQ